MSIPEEVNRAPSADLREVFRDTNESAEIEVMTRTEDGIFHRAGVGPSAGIGAFPALMGTGEARVDDLSLGVYAPSSHALVIKPCEVCLGVATFVFRRNRRVEEALGRLDRSERLQAEVDSLKASNAKLLGRLLPAEVRLQRALERQREAEGSSGMDGSGRDWLVKELTRVSREARALQVGRLEREETMLEAHREMGRAGAKYKAEAEAASASFRSRLSEAHEELETLREALLQSNAETRSEASRAIELEKEALSLRQTAERAHVECRRLTGLLAEADRRAMAAVGDAVVLRGRLRKATEEGVEKEQEAGHRLHEAALALEAEGKNSLRLTAKLDDANALIFTLRERVSSVAADMGRKDAEIAAAASSAATSASPPVPLLALPKQAPAPPGSPRCRKVDAFTSMSAPPSSSNDYDSGGAESGGRADAGGGPPLVRGVGARVDGCGNAGSGGGGSVVCGGRRGEGKPAAVRKEVRLAARACGLGVKRGLRLAALGKREGLDAGAAVGEGQGQEEEGAVSANGTGVSQDDEGLETEEEEVERKKKEEGDEGEEKARHQERALSEISRVCTEGDREKATDERHEEALPEPSRETSRGIRGLNYIASLMERLRSAVDLLTDSMDSIPWEGEAEGSAGVGNAAGAVVAAIESPDTPGAPVVMLRASSAITSSTRGSDDDKTAPSAVQEAGELLMARVEKATGGVLSLRARLAAAMKCTDLGRTVREAERVRTAKLVSVLRSEAQDLRRKPQTAHVGAQTALKSSDLREKEAFTLSLERKHKGVELGFEAFRQDVERAREVEMLENEEKKLTADKRLHASHVRESNARYYCQRLEARVAALLAHRGALRQERQVLRAAVRASFRDAAEKECRRRESMRTAATQVRCAVCAVRGGEHTAIATTAAATTASATTTAAVLPRSGSAGPAFSPTLLGVGASLLQAAGDGGKISPLAVVAARVQQKRTANADQGTSRTCFTRLAGATSHPCLHQHQHLHQPYHHHQQYVHATPRELAAAKRKGGRKQRPASAGHQHPHQHHQQSCVHATPKALTVAAELNLGKKQRPVSAGRVASRRSVVASAALATTGQSCNSSSSSSSGGGGGINGGGGDNDDIPRRKHHLGEAAGSSGSSLRGGGGKVDDDDENNDGGGGGSGERTRSSTRSIVGRSDVRAKGTGGADTLELIPFHVPRAVEKVQVSWAH